MSTVGISIVNKLRVYHFLLDNRIGGPHIYVENLKTTLSPYVESIMVTAGRGAMTDVELLNLRHISRWLYPIEICLNTLIICWYFRRLRLDTNVLFNVHSAANMAPLLAAKILTIPVVWHFHETTDRFTLFADVGKLICLKLLNRKVVVAKKSITVYKIPNASHIAGAVDINFWGDKIKLQLPSEKSKYLRILSVANLNPLKGLDVLLAALERVSFPWELVVVGAELKTHSNFARMLRKIAKQFPLSRKVCFVGWKSRQEVRELMFTCDVFVLPSRSEACPLVLLEAMAAGCACIATDVGDVSEIIASKSCGIVVSNNSPDEFAVALESMASIGDSKRRNMGHLARKSTVARYSLEDQAKKHLDIYAELVAIRVNK